MSLTAISEGLVARGHRVTIVCRPNSALHQRAASLHSTIVPLRIAGDINPFTIWKIRRLIARHAVDVTSLVQARYPLERALDAFDHAQRPGMLKVLLDVA